MKEREIKLFPEPVLKKLLSLREEGISQDVNIFPVLLFVGIKENIHLTYERILKLLNDEAFPFRGEILDVHKNYVVISFDIFREFGDEVSISLSLALRLSTFEFVNHVFISRERGVFHYVNIKGREFVFIDSDVYNEFISISGRLDSGIYLDENVYSFLYHNLKVEPIENRILRVVSIREYFLPTIRPRFIGSNPLHNISRNGQIITLRGDKGSGKTRSALEFLLDGGFERIAYVKLSPYSRYSPFSAIYELADSLSFYSSKRNETDPPGFVKEILLNTGKTAIFFEDAQYIDMDSREFLQEIMGFASGSTTFIFENGERWDGEVTVMMDGYVESKGVAILKGLAGGRKPDKSILEVLNAIKDIDYQFVYDFYTVFSLRKFFIFGEDVFYLSPSAHGIKKGFEKDKLYELLFEVLDEIELTSLLKVSLRGGRVSLDEIKFPGIVRLIRHGILRVDGKHVVLCSSNVKDALLAMVGKERILSLLENDIPADNYLFRGFVLEYVGEKRSSFREFKRYVDTHIKDYSTASSLLNKLLELEPTDAERIEILLKLYEWKKRSKEYGPALSYLKEALNSAKSMGDRSRISLVLYELGRFNLETGQSGAALMNLKDARKFALEANDQNIYVSATLKMAEFYYKKDDIEKLGEIIKELRSHTVEDKEHKAKVLFYQGIYNLRKGDFNKAHSILEDAYNVSQSTGDITTVSRILAALGKVELVFEQYKVAKKFAEEALTLNSDCTEARLVASRVKFVEGNVKEALKILSEANSEENELLFDLAALLAYEGKYRKAIEHLDKLLTRGRGSVRTGVLKRKVRYLLRLGHYAEAYEILNALKDDEIEDEFNLFLMGQKYRPKTDIPYVKAVMAFTSLSDVADLDSSVINDYAYIDARWMIDFSRGLKELVRGSYEMSYDIMKRIDNTYYRSSLAVNIAKYVKDRGGDGDMFLKEAGEVAEEEGYLEVLMWIYLILGKKDKAEGLFEKMFKGNDELRHNYVQARKEIFDKI